MTLKELSQLYYLNREINYDRERLGKLRGAVLSFPPTTGGSTVSGGDKPSKVEKLTAEIVDLENEISDKILKSIRERKKIELYISGICDSRIRIIFKLRFIDCLSWTAVAYKMGGGNTAESVKKMCYRFLKNEKLG